MATEKLKIYKVGGTNKQTNWTNPQIKKHKTATNSD